MAKKIQNIPQIDINPQFTSHRVTQVTENTFVTSEWLIPQPVSLPNGKTIVFELLKIWFYFYEGDTDSKHDMWLSTKELTDEPIPSDTSVLTFDSDKRQIQTSGAFQVYAAREYDLTDGAGNGVLVAVSKLHLAMKSTGQASPHSQDARILYRLRIVNVEEFVGIAQQQQG